MYGKTASIQFLMLRLIIRYALMVPKIRCLLWDLNLYRICGLWAII